MVEKQYFIILNACTFAQHINNWRPTQSNNRVQSTVSIRMSALINLITKVKVSLLVVLLLVCSAVLSAPVQSTNTVTMSTNDHHNDHPPKPTQDHSPGCHFKNTEIALPITFSLEMPSYVMVGGHKFNLKLQMPNINI
ncbi:hypothetical protein BgiMline_003812 [Biomphalaria glabrata]